MDDDTGSWTGPLIKASLLFIAYSYVDMRVASDIFLRRMNLVDPTVLYMSCFLGLYAFGISGIIYGPLLVSTGAVIYQASQ